MRAVALAWLAIKQLWRHPLRSGLTVVGVATGMFLYAAVETLQEAVAEATEQSAGDDRLVVYRENRFCPFTSRLPERYEDRIASIPGVASAVPVKVVVNNCRTSLDVVTFRGIPAEDYDDLLGDAVQLSSGSLAAWRQRGDAALVGDVLARRRGLQVGDSFDAAGVTAHVAGIIAADRPQDRNVAYVSLPFLQQAARGGLGEVTQFTVRVTDPRLMEEVADRIDEAFASDSDPTHTRPEQAFVAEVGKSLLELVGFTRWVGLGAVVAVLALIANTIALAVRSRVKEIAVLGTLGFGDLAIAWLVLVEGLVLGLAGGLLGGGAAWLVLHLGGYGLSSEGLSIIVDPDAGRLLVGALLAGVLGLLAGLWPAWRAVRQPIVASLRMA